jgi:O-antigen/teichoic acid export membrane protein
VTADAVTAPASRGGTSDLTRRASLNGLALGADYAARLAVGLVLNPLFLGHLGASLYGMWAVIQRLVNHVSPAGGRPGEALKWLVARDQHSTDVSAKRRQVGNAVVVWLLFLPLVGALGGVLCWSAPAWLDASGDEAVAVRLAVAVLVLNLLLAGLVNLPQAALQGENLAYRRLGLSTSMVLVGGVLSGAAVIAGAGIVGLAAATLVTTLLTGVTYLHIVRTHVPWFGVARPTPDAVRRFVGISWWFLVWNLVMIAMKGADLVVIGIAGSTTMAAAYALSTYVPVAASDTVALAISSAMPGLGGLIGAGKIRAANAIRAELMAVSWLLATVAGVGVLLWQESFLRLWVGSGYYVGTPATVLIVVMVLQLAVLRTDANIIDLTLQLRGKVLLGLLSVVLSVALGWWAVGVMGWGVTGAVAGFLAGRLLLTVAYPALIGRKLGQGMSAQVAAALRPAVASSVVFAAAAWLGTRLEVTSWWTFAGVVVTSTAPLAVLVLLLGLPARQRAALSRRVRRVRRRR